MANILAKLKARLAGAKQEQTADKTEELTEEIETQDDEQSILSEEPIAQSDSQGATEEESALLARLADLRITSGEDVRRSFLAMRAYTFCAPFAREDIADIAKALRFLGFRIYSLEVETGEKTTSFESYAAFIQAVLEADDGFTGCTLSGSYSAARVSCHIDPSGSVQITHDISRPVSLEPFEELFTWPNTERSDMSE